MKRLLVGIVLLPLAVQAGIYKCQKNGETIYSQHPCGDNVTVIKQEPKRVQSKEDEELRMVRKRVKETGDTCLFAENVAQNIMRMRQKGVPMSELMHLVDKSGNADAIQYNMVIVSAAFKEPRWHSEEAQERAVQDFKEMMYKACLTAKATK